MMRVIVMSTMITMMAMFDGNKVVRAIMAVYICVNIYIHTDM